MNIYVLTKVKFKSNIVTCITSLSFVLTTASPYIDLGCSFVRQTCYPLDCMDTGFLYTSACDCTSKCLLFNGTCTCPPDCSNSDCAPDYCKEGIMFKNPCDCYNRCVRKRDVEGVINCLGIKCPHVDCLPRKQYIPKNECCPVCK